jgi:hypothetical protein
MNYNNRDISSKYCNLCLGNSLDTMDHLLRCPALAKEQIRLKENVIQRFNFWAIPYASIPQKQRELVLRAQWRSLARQHFTSAVILEVPAPSRLSIDVDPSVHLGYAGIHGFLELLATLRRMDFRKHL